MSAIERYNAMVMARYDQQRRLTSAFDASYWDRFAHTYRFDPHREPEPQLAAALRHIEPDDEIIEIGGGAGRIGLPMARKAATLTNVEPSSAMREQFHLAASDFEITNATSIPFAWPTDLAMQADVVVTVDVTYFISDIAPFILAMDQAARRRAMILTWTIPPPNVNAPLFRTAFGEDEVSSPGFRELLPAVWELGIVPDVQLIGETFSWPERLPKDDDGAVRFALEELGIVEHSAAEANIRERLDELFERRGDVYLPSWRPPSRAMLITWCTA